MRDALRLMSKVFAAVFGAGFAVVILSYLVLGGLYIYTRIESSKHAATQPDYDALAKQAGAISSVEPSSRNSQVQAIPLYDKGSHPDFIPPAQLDCQQKKIVIGDKTPACIVKIDGKMAAIITEETAKDNLAGWMDVEPVKK